MTDVGRLAVAALVSRLLIEPDGLDALARRDLTFLRGKLAADAEQISTLAALDVRALHHYRRLLQRKRLEMLEPIFFVSVQEARNQYGVDPLAAGFWDAYRQPESVPVSDLLPELAQAWTEYAAGLALSGPLDWLGDLSRYEYLRWKAVFFSEFSSDPAGTPPGLPGTARPVLAPGATVATFDVDVPVVLRSLLDGQPQPPSRTTRLVMWCTPEGKVAVLRLGAAAYAALHMCDGSHAVSEIAATIGGGNGQGADLVVDLLHSLSVRGGLQRTGEPLSAKHQDPEPV